MREGCRGADKPGQWALYVPPRVRAILPVTPERHGRRGGELHHARQRGLQRDRQEQGPGIDAAIRFAGGR